MLIRKSASWRIRPMNERSYGLIAYSSSDTARA